MFEPNEIEGVPERITQIFRQLQQDIMSDLIERLSINQEITRAADWEIHRLYELGNSKRAIKKHIKNVLGLSAQEINHIYKNVLRQGYARNEQLYKVKGKPWIRFEDNQSLQQLIESTISQTNSECYNITNSLGCAVRNSQGELAFKPIAKYYQDTLDSASSDILSGAFDYRSVLNKTVKEMTDSGLRTVDYASGHSNRVDVAARRAVLTGFNQVVAKINEKNAQELETDHFEVTYHIGARPTHQVWQGRVYSSDELKNICGYGEVDGLKGANCYHDFHPFILGISKRIYTDEELDRMNAEENTPKKFGDKEYTTYEALQRQRKLETKLRAQRQTIHLLEKGGSSEDDVIAAKSRYFSTSDEYARFSEAMGLPQQRERVNIDGLKGVDPSIGKPVAKSEKSGIIESNQAGTAVSDVHYIGRIDRNLYSCITENITTDELIITEKQVEHIFKSHPNDFKDFHDVIDSIKDTVIAPDYIIESEKPNTAFILKELSTNRGKSRLIMRLKTNSDPDEYKNSIITFQKMREKEWKRIIRNKKILYKSE